MRLTFKYCFFGIFAWYVLLISWHFLDQRPLWMDEQWVLNNIVQLSPKDLFSRALVSDQAFPRLYLYIIQQFSNAFDHAPWSLRFFPFLCMLAAFVIWMRIGFTTLSHHVDRLNFALCWAASIPLIYYAAELKQYSMDVLAASILVYLSLRVTQAKLNPFWFLLFPVLGLFSYPVFFLMLIPVFILWRNKKVLLSYGGICITMVLCVWYFDIRNSATHLLETYWHEYFISFASVPAFFQTFTEGVNNLISRWFVENPKSFRGMARFFVGIGFCYMLWQGVKYFKGNQKIMPVATVALLIFIELVILGCLRKLPFTVPRISLFFAPILLLVMVQSFAECRQRWPKCYWPLQWMLWAYLGTMSLGIARVIFNGNLGAQSIIWSIK
jgi:hypothetical protein